MIVKLEALFGTEMARVRKRLAQRRRTFRAATPKLHLVPEGDYRIRCRLENTGNENYYLDTTCGQ